MRPACWHGREKLGFRGERRQVTAGTHVPLLTTCPALSLLSLNITSSRRPSQTIPSKLCLLGYFHICMYDRGDICFS